MSLPDPPKNSKRVWAVYLAPGLAMFGMNWMSLHGVNFEVLGVPSEVVKAGIESHILLFLLWVTGDNLVQSVVDFILWIRQSAAKIKDAFTRNLQQMRKP